MMPRNAQNPNERTTAQIGVCTGGSSTSLADWVQANLHPPLTMTSITWGNADEAAQLSDNRRIALTPHHVVVLDLRSGQGHLDLEAQMSARLSTWNFSY